MGMVGGVLDRSPLGTGPEPDDSQWVHRFGRTERFAHWWTVTTVSAALLSGLAMGDDGGFGPLFLVHAGSVVLLGLGLFGATVFGDRQALASVVRALVVIDARDRIWLRAVARHPLHRPPEPAWGMFNAGQKLMTWAVAGSLVGVIVTGIQSWAAGGEGGLHSAFVVVTGVLLMAHVFMAVVNPATRHALYAMVFGRVRRSWAMQHHQAWARSARPVSHR